MRQPRKIFAQAKKEDHITPNKMGVVPLKCDHTGEVEWKRGRREDGSLHGQSRPEQIRSGFMRQMGKRSGTARHSCGAAEELQQTDRKCMVKVQLSLPALPDTAARRKLHRQTTICSTGWARTGVAIQSCQARIKQHHTMTL